MQIFVRCGPFPRSDDDIPFFAFGAWWLALGKLAFGNAIGPVAEILVRDATKLPGDPVCHLLTGLAGLYAPLPGFGARVEFPQRCRNRARRFLSDLVAADAVDVVHLPQPVVLRDVLRNVG